MKSDNYRIIYSNGSPIKLELKKFEENFLIVIRDYNIEEIYVENIRLTRYDIMNTRLWDIVNNIIFWINHHVGLWSKDGKQYITDYPYRVMPEHFEITKETYNDCLKIIKEISNYY